MTTESCHGRRFIVIALLTGVDCFYQPAGSDQAATSNGSETTTPTSGAKSETSSSTGETAPCPEGSVCSPGAKQGAKLCEPCGVLTQTCTESCEWSAPVCEEDLATCAYWSLPRGGVGWQRHPVSVDPQAPIGDILAGFGVPTRNEAYVLTANSYSVLDVSNPDDPQWTRSGDSGDLHSALIGFTPQFAYYTPAAFYAALMMEPFPPEEGRITVSDQDGDYFDFRYIEVDGLIKPGAQGIGDQGNFYDLQAWKEPAAPAVWQVRDAWQDFDDASGFLGLTIADVCPEPMPEYEANPVTYLSYVTDDEIRLAENYRCPRFFDQNLPQEAPPFSLPGAPPLALVGGIAHVDALYVFRGPH